MSEKPIGRRRSALVTLVALAAMSVPVVVAVLGLAGALRGSSYSGNAGNGAEVRYSLDEQEYLRSRLETAGGWRSWVSRTQKTATDLASNVTAQDSMPAAGDEDSAAYPAQMPAGRTVREE
ncbi:MAG: hypothetical protein FJ316_12365 [SAR202 cluster bacterium]|nr:hypothetical protein [SAR202 cluster bacterium]